MIAIGALILLIFMLCAAGPSFSPTEQFIPMNESPGVSGILSVVGTITKADPRTKIVCVQQSIAQHELYCTNYSHAMVVYLDRSHLHQTNLVGGWPDLQLGRTVEVYPGHWIKVRMEP